MTFKFIKPKALELIGAATTISSFIAVHPDGCKVPLALIGNESELIKRNVVTLEDGETGSGGWLVIFTDMTYHSFPTEEAAKEFLLKKYGGQTA